MSEAMELTHTFSFEAAHFLPHVPEDHKCRRMHGHSFFVDVMVHGEVEEKSGWVQDFGEIKAAMRGQIPEFDQTRAVAASIEKDTATLRMFREQMLKGEVKEPAAMRQWVAEQKALGDFQDVPVEAIEEAGTPFDGQSLLQYEKATRELNASLIAIREVIKNDKPESGEEMMARAMSGEQSNDAASAAQSQEK